MNKFSKYVGLDTHKDTIAVAVSDACGGSPRYYGQIANTPEALTKLVKKLSTGGEVLSFCYEAG
ncbi:MAG: IS110 family transposase, partial [bacterium]|nr:IS110 family transposase [bacterium]